MIWSPSKGVRNAAREAEESAVLRGQAQAFSVGVVFVFAASSYSQQASN